ncbi:hypothetical protein pipiens_020125, partial [Culex pipiens pipiens]
MRIKVPKQKDKMTPGQQQLQSTEDASHHQQHQQQIPNIAGTIGTSDKHQHHHHNQHSQFLHGSSPHLHQFSHLQHLHNQHQHHHLPQLHPLSSSVTGGSTGLLTGGGPNGSAPSTLTSGNKLPAKTSPIGPSPFRQLLPVALCIISFATVLSVLIIYMDTTEIRHQQFRLNMSRDYDLMGVPQDNPALVKYVRDIHMKKYPMTFMRNANAPVEHLNFTNRHELTPEMAHFVSDLLGKKRFGTFFQSLTGISESMMTAPAPSGRALQVNHACLSPNTYPKEVTLHHDDDSEVRINSVLDEETEWFHPRVKCFPVYTLMLAVNRTSIDVMSLGCQGQELQILQTIPFDRVHVKVITIHLVHYYEEDELIIDVDEYVQNITRFLLSKSYKLVRSFDRNFIYQYVSVNGGGGGASLSRVNSVVAPSSAAILDAASSSAENKISRGAKGEVRKLGTTMASPPAAAVVPVVVTSSVSVSVGAAELMGEGSTERGAIVLEEVSGSSSSTSSPPMVTSV